MAILGTGEVAYDFGNGKIAYNTGASQVPDVTGNGNDGEVGGQLGLATRKGLYGRAFDFQFGAGDGIVIADFDFTGITAFAVLNLDAVGWGGIAAATLAAQASKEWMWITNATGEMLIYTYPTDGSVELISTALNPLVVGTQSIIGVTADGTNNKLYQNGIEVAYASKDQGTTGGIRDGNTPVSLGIFNAASRINGVMTYFEMWEGAKSAADMYTMYEEILVKKAAFDIGNRALIA